MPHSERENSNIKLHSLVEDRLKNARPQTRKIRIKTVDEYGIRLPDIGNVSTGLYMLHRRMTALEHMFKLIGDKPVQACDVLEMVLPMIEDVYVFACNLEDMQVEC